MITGCDLSHWQGLVDWDKLNANPDIGFVVMKATEGKALVDDKFARNWALCKKPKAAYHFWRYAVDGPTQARFYFDEVTKVIGADKMRPVFDYEDTAAPKDANAPSALKEFHEAAQATWFGRTPLVYTGAWWWDAWIKKDLCGSNPLWIASYTSTAIMPKTGGWPEWRAWQYTSSGKVDGIAGNVDMNRFNGTQEEMEAFFYFGAPEPPPPPSGDWDEARVAGIEAQVAGQAVRLNAIEAKLAAIKEAL